MSDSFRLSIVTVVLNDREGFLATAQSLVPQLVPEVEWIVIDGASTDGTLEEARAQGPAIATLVSEPDRGIYDAMNKGAALCTGDYVLFMNAGDRFTERAISIALDHIKNSDGREVLCGDWHEVSGSISTPKTAQPDLLTKYMTLSHQATYIPLDLLSEFNGYSCKYTLAADYDLFVRMACKGVKFTTIDVPLVHFYTGGITDQRHLTSFLESVLVLWRNKSPHRLSGTCFYAESAMRHLMTRVSRK